MPYIAALIAQGIAWVFRSQIGQWLVGGLVFLGLSIATNELAVEPAINYLLGQIQSNVPAQIVGWLGVMNIDKYITIILSAYVSAAALGAGKAFLTRRK